MISSVNILIIKTINGVIDEIDITSCRLKPFYHEL